MVEMLPLHDSLPVGTSGSKSVTWWGIWTLIVTEASLFGYLLLTYFYLYSQNTEHWPPEGKPSLLMPGINTALLLASSVFVYLSEKSLRRRSRSIALMGIAIALGIAFVGIQCGEWKKKPYGPTTDLYGSLYFTITGFHMAHVVVGLIMLILLMLWTRLGYFTGKKHMAITVGGLYWHFVDAVWLVVFTCLYLIPYIQR